MRLIERLEQHGSFLFRWRGVLPLLLIPFVLTALPRTVAIEHALGAYGCMAISLTGLLVPVRDRRVRAAGNLGPQHAQPARDHPQHHRPLLGGAQPPSMSAIFWSFSASRW